MIKEIKAFENFLTRSDKVSQHWMRDIDEGYSSSCLKLKLYNHL